MSLDKLKREINKKYNSELMIKGSQVKKVDRWSTGSLALDLELGGGYPVGRITSIIGEYSDGKTSLALIGAGEFQRKYPNKEILWMDVEGSWDAEWATKLGVKEDEVWVVQAEYQQQAFDIINKAIEYDVGLVVVDSVAALVPKEEAEASFEQWNVGLAARINSKAMRGFQSTLNTKAAENSELPPSIILLNQLRDKITQSKYRVEDEPGGRAIKFHAAVRIFLKKGDLYPKPRSNYDVSIVPKAQQIKFHIEKNKTFVRHRRGWTWFYFDDLDALRRKGSIDHVEELVRYCKDYAVLDEYAKGRFNFTNPVTGEIEQIHGINTFATKLREHPELIEPLKEELLSRVKDRYGSVIEKSELEDTNISSTNEDEGTVSGEEIPSLEDSSFWSDTLGEAGPQNGELLDPTQAKW